MENISRFTVRTSGRRCFRRCLRKWGFASSMKRNLQVANTGNTNIYFWFGSGIHFALEDYYGYRKFDDPRLAFEAYVEAFPIDQRPDRWQEHVELGLGMLTYLLEWMPKHNIDMQFQTLWLDENNKEATPNTPGARPMVEQSFTLGLDRTCWIRTDTSEIVHVEDPATLLGINGSDDLATLIDGKLVTVKEIPIHYHGTFDRIVVDKYGRWWLWDWKTAKSIDTNKLETDDQINAYLWAAEQYFEHPFEGFVYYQMCKDVPKPARILKNGGVSTDQKQKTTAALYKQALIQSYGDVFSAPEKNQQLLEKFQNMESPEGDSFIRWDFIRKTRMQKIKTYENILAEVDLMLNPELVLFPNPTRDCSWECSFRHICIAMDEGRPAEEIEGLIEEDFEQRPHTEDNQEELWRKRIWWPGMPKPQELIDEQESTLELIMPDRYGEDCDE